MIAKGFLITFLLAGTNAKHHRDGGATAALEHKAQISKFGDEGVVDIEHEVHAYGLGPDVYVSWPCSCLYHTIFHTFSKWSPMPFFISLSSKQKWLDDAKDQDSVARSIKLKDSAKFSGMLQSDHKHRQEEDSNSTPYASNSLSNTQAPNTIIGELVDMGKNLADDVVKVCW